MSFPRILTAVLCGGFLLLGTAQAQQTERELRTCKLRLAWWNAPENPPELALQKDKERTPFSPDTLALSQVIEYSGEPNAVILKKTLTAEVDKAGKPISQWVPYCSIPVGPNDTDLAVLLFPDDKRGVAQTRVFDFSPDGFPYGSIQLVNFTTARIAVSIDGTTFAANSRGVARYPKLIVKPAACSFKMAAAETNGEQKLLRSTTMIFRPTSRILLFAVEVPGAEEDGRYHTELIVDNLTSRPQSVAAPAAEPKGRGVPTQKAKKGATKNTPEAPL
jgi:hypothetical protein